MSPAGVTHCCRSPSGHYSGQSRCCGYARCPPRSPSPTADADGGSLGRSGGRPATLLMATGRIAAEWSWSWSVVGEVLHEDGSGVEEVEAAALGVVLGPRCRLGGDHADIAAGSGGVGEAGGQQSGLDAVAAVCGECCGAGELSDAV